MFTYLVPHTLDEAISLLAQYAPEGKPLAGGQSLIPMMNFRLAQPRYLIDLNRVNELGYVREIDGMLAIGAMTRQFEAERSEVVSRLVPILSEALHWTGHATIRHRGTVGGSLAHADPAAELPATALALRAELVAQGPAGRRVIPAEEFFLGPLSTALGPDELLVEARFPALPSGAGWAFLELSRRHGDFAIVGVAAVLALSGDGRVDQVSLALCGVGPAPVRARRAEAALAGVEPSEGAFREAGEIAAQEIDPDSDLHASADYRRRVAAVLVRRALVEAHRRASGGR
jgi:CO/xanthine dehydrogenase FAD-binding subunit